MSRSIVYEYSRCERCAALVRGSPDANSRQKAHRAYLEEARGGWSVSVPNVLGYCLVAALSMMITACGGGGGGAGSSGSSSSSSSSSSSGGPPWSVSGGQIYQDGIVLSESSNVILMLYYNAGIYQQNSACGVWEYVNANWTLTTLPIQSSYGGPQNSGPTIPVSVLNQCPGMGGAWYSPGPDGAYTHTITTAQGELFSVGYPGIQGCTTFAYGTVSNVNNVLNGTGFALPPHTSLGGCSMLNPSAVQISGSVNPRVSLNLSGVPAGYSYVADYEIPLASLSVAQGTYTVNTSDTMTIDLNGIVNLQEAATGCTFTGQVSVLGQFNSIYRINVTANNCVTLPTWNGMPEQGIIQLGIPPKTFGGTTFVDTNGQQQIKMFATGGDQYEP
jgi:hypothetical protein